MVNVFVQYIKKDVFENLEILFNAKLEQLKEPITYSEEPIYEKPSDRKKSVKFSDQVI